MTTSKTPTKWDRKYLERLAEVYLEKYSVLGYKEAKKWYSEFLTTELRKLVHPIIVEKVETKQGKSDK